MREELAAVHRALRRIIGCLTMQLVVAPVCLFGLATWAWLQAAECFTWNQDKGEKD
jgi:hypothetical protein